MNVSSEELMLCKSSSCCCLSVLRGLRRDSDDFQGFACAKIPEATEAQLVLPI